MKIYYHNDADGRCSAAIVLALHATPNCELIECDYNKEIDLSTIEVDEEIIIVDFSFKPEVMYKLLEITLDVIWIDHHITTMSYDYNNDSIDGIRSIEYAACELTWQYFMQDDNPHNVPWAVKYIGDYDNWEFKYANETKQFYEGLKMFDTSPQSELWVSLFNNENIVQIGDAGFYATTYRNKYCQDIRDAYSYETIFEGHRALCMNVYKFGSFAFGDKFNHYDMCISYIHDGSNYVVSLYSDGKINVSEVAKKYGGGGHVGAAGFVMGELPFKKVDTI